MKTFSVEEASKHLSELVKSASEGEEIAFRDGACAVLLQAVSGVSANRLSPREALRQLQSESQVTAAQADSYLREVRAERLSHGN